MNTLQPPSQYSAGAVEMTDTTPIVTMTIADWRDDPQLHASEAPTSEDLVIFTSPHCPFCVRVEDLFRHFDVDPTLIDTADPKNEAMYHAAAERTKHFTLPLVMYKGELVGGCDDTCAAIERGDFARMVNLPTCNSVTHAGTPRPDLVPPAVFSFPILVDSWVIRLIAFFVMVVSVIIIAFRQYSWAWWVTFGMMLDFILRLMFGGTASVLGSTASLFLFWKEPLLVCGPPKQFASLVGVVMYLSATIAFLVGDGSDGGTYCGVAILAVIVIFAGLEAFVDFCAGCLVFSYLMKVGIVSESVYQPYTDSYQYTACALEELNLKVGWSEEPPLAEEGLTAAAANTSTLGWRRKFLDERFRPTRKPLPKPLQVSEMLPPDTAASAIDLTYKFPKVEETQREKWSFKYLTFTDFNSCAGTAGIACLLKAIQSQFDMPSEAWKVMAIVSAVHFGVFLLILLAKVFLAPRRVSGDLQNPLERNMSAVVPMVFLLMSYLAVDIDNNLALVMFWCGTPAIALAALFTIVYYLRNHQTRGAYNPTLLYAILGMFVVAMVTPALAATRSSPSSTAYFMECAMWFWTAGVFFFVSFFSGTLYHGIFFHWSADRMRSSVTVWMGLSFITSISWLAVTKQTAFDSVAFIFFVSGIALYLCVLYLIFPCKWLYRNRFDMHHWHVCFPLSLFGIAAASYHHSQRHAFSYGVCWVAWVSAVYATYCCVMHTLRLLCERKWPGPAADLAPLGFNKLVHDGLHELQARLIAECHFAPKLSERTNADNRLLEMASHYLQLLRIHTQYESRCVLPELKSFCPAQVAVAEEQHKHTMAEAKRIEELAEELRWVAR